MEEQTEGPKSPWAMSVTEIREEARRRRERDRKVFYELHENDFTKIMREIDCLPPDKLLEGLQDRLKKAYSLRHFAELNPQSPLNPSHLIAQLEKEITKRVQNPSSASTQMVAGEKEQKSKSTYKKIRWEDENQVIVALFLLLREAKKINPRTKIPSAIANHFKDQNNDDFDSSSLKSEKNKVLSDYEKAEKLFKKLLIEDLTEAADRLLDIIHNRDIKPPVN